MTQYTVVDQMGEHMSVTPIMASSPAEALVCAANLTGLLTYRAIVFEGLPCDVNAPRVLMDHLKAEK